MNSVVLACRCGMPYLTDQLDSIIAQMSTDDELIVADQGSDDGSWEEIQSRVAVDPRIRAIRTAAPTTGGRKGCRQSPNPVVANFGAGLAEARGELVFLSDQDDIWLPHKMRRAGEWFADHPRLMAICADADLIDGNGQLLAPSFFRLRGSGPGFLRNWMRNTWQGCSMVFRRELLELVLPLPPRLPMHDQWIGLLADAAGEIRFVDEIWIRYRRHGANLSALVPSGVCRRISNRLYISAQLLKCWPRLCRFAVAVRRRAADPRQSGL